MPKKSDSTFTALCRLLSRREHSELELIRKLIARGHAKSDIEIGIQKAQQLDIQNDQRFSEMLARTRLSQGYGPLRISMELKTHNILPHIAQASIAAIEADISCVIQKLFKKKFSSAVLNAQHISWFHARGFSIDWVRKSLAGTFTA